MEGKGSTRCQVVVVEGGAWGKKRARRFCILDARFSNSKKSSLCFLDVEENVFSQPGSKNHIVQFAFARVLEFMGERIRGRT